GARDCAVVPGGVADHDIAAFAAFDGVIALARVIHTSVIRSKRVTDYAIVSRIAIDDVRTIAECGPGGDTDVTEQVVIADPAVDRIIVRAARNRIVARVAAQTVVPDAAIDGVVVRAAGNGIAARATDNGILPGVAEQTVTPGPAIDGVVVRAAENGIAATVTEQVVVAVSA